MRIGNLNERLVIIDGHHALDVEEASNGRFLSDPQAIYEQWATFTRWAAHQDAAGGLTYDAAELGPAVPCPRQVMAIGLNYATHASESGFELPDNPVVFTKFVSSFIGPEARVSVHGDKIDWEAELVAIIGQGGRNIPEEGGWNAIAGLSIGQDLSDREVQFWGNPPQFNLGKSREGFAPLGPSVVTLDEVDAKADRNDLGICCSVTHADGSQEILQQDRTSNLIFTIPSLVARLSSIVELLPGDVIFTGTPAGVGIGRDPQVFLHPGDTLTTEIETLGSIRQKFI